jgi:hypothetical protein
MHMLYLIESIVDKWMILIGNQSILTSVYSCVSCSWQMMPYRFVFYPVVAPGAHTYSIQFYSNSASNICGAGYPATSNNYLLVEEIEERL